MEAPITVPPPGRKSMISGCPSGTRSRSKTGRATTSMEPPGGNGLITRMGFDGYGACAYTAPASAQLITQTMVWRDKNSWGMGISNPLFHQTAAYLKPAERSTADA